MNNSNKENKKSIFYCMFDGEQLIELSLGFLKCPKCTSIFLPSQLQGRQILQEVYKDTFKNE